MKRVFTLFVFVIICFSANAQWTSQTSGITSYLYSVCFVDASNGWAVGDGGVILVTANGGSSWDPQSTQGVTSSLKGVFFIDASHGWVVGSGGSGNKSIFLSTANGGNNWSVKASDTLAILRAVSFTSTTNGVAVGDAGVIYHTTDGGTTWSLIASGTTSNLRGVSFGDASNGWAVGDAGTILVTTDGGGSWTSQTSGSGASLWDVSFADATHGWAVGQAGVVRVTTDGSSWSAQTSGVTGYLYGVHFLSDALNGWAVGAGGNIIGTTNGGSTWNPQTSPTTNNTYAVFFTDANNGWAVASGGVIIGTTNGGLPVELASFSASVVKNSVELSWKTSTEVNNYGFDVERSSSNQGWQKIGFVPGSGNSNSPKEYSYTDNPSGGTTFSYRLKQIDVDGSFKYYDAVTVNLTTPSEPQLLQNSPNPFNPSTTIKFYIPNTSDVTIRIYDMLGREVTTLINQQATAGYHVVYWNGKDSRGEAAASGVYLYRLTAGSFSETKKMNLLK